MRSGRAAGEPAAAQSAAAAARSAAPRGQRQAAAATIVHIEERTAHRKPKR